MNIAVLGLVRAIGQRGHSDGVTAEEFPDSSAMEIITHHLRGQEVTRATETEYRVLSALALVRNNLRASLNREPNDLELAREIALPPGSVAPDSRSAQAPRADRPQQAAISHSHVPPAPGQGEPGGNKSQRRRPRGQ